MSVAPRRKKNVNEAKGEKKNTKYNSALSCVIQIQNDTTEDTTEFDKKKI